MSYLPPLSFVDYSGNQGLIILLATIFSLSIPIIGIVLWYDTRRRREQLWHETARIALEKGQPIPSRPLSDEELKHQLPPAGTNLTEWSRLKRAARRRADTRGGMIMTAIGLALYLSHFGGRESFLSYVPLFIGIALLLNALLDGKFSGKSDDFGDHPPQS